MAVQRENGLRAGFASRSWLIVALLALIMLLVIGMAWQAQRSVDAHNETAIGVLQDYAGLAADEFARRAMAATGYYGYYAAINDLTGTTDIQQSGDGPAKYVFRVALDNRALEIPGSAGVAAEIRNYILDTLTPRTGDKLPDAGFLVDHALIGDAQHTFVITWNDPATEMLGFEADRQWLQATLQSAFDENPLLPPSLANGAVTNELLYLRMDDGAGHAIIETGEPVDDPVLVTRSLAEEYNGVFASHTISISMDPELSDSLVIGGLPKSRLPLLLAIILLAAGLLFVAIRQLQREHAVMQMRSNFVAEVSHELRTPLTQIRMFTESLLLHRLPSEDDRLRALTIINRESQRLIHMVENILRFAEGQREQSALAPQQQSVAPIVESVVDEFQVLADATDATMETDIDSTVEAFVDADALRQVLINLLDNAIKYGPQGQRVRITLQSAINMAVITISDQGPGIPRSERQSIWQGYYRLDRERDSAIAGTGIGLAVVGDIVQRHGGRVRVEDAEHGGAQFIVELPR